jgi:hypothetical protein
LPRKLDPGHAGALDHPIARPASCNHPTTPYNAGTTDSGALRWRKELGLTAGAGYSGTQAWVADVSGGNKTLRRATTAVSIT